MCVRAQELVLVKCKVAIGKRETIAQSNNVFVLELLWDFVYLRGVYLTVGSYS